MKSRKDFDTIGEFRDYLIAYYCGQILACAGAFASRKLTNEQDIYDSAAILASVVLPPDAFETDDAPTVPQYRVNLLANHTARPEQIVDGYLSYDGIRPASYDKKEARKKARMFGGGIEPV